MCFCVCFDLFVLFVMVVGVCVPCIVCFDFEFSLVAYADWLFGCVVLLLLDLFVFNVLLLGLWF